MHLHENLTDDTTCILEEDRATGPIAALHAQGDDEAHAARARLQSNWVDLSVVGIEHRPTGYSAAAAVHGLVQHLPTELHKG